MNLCGSYRTLRDNSKAALVASIEIYNKPTFRYRDECFVILLVNAWELLVKSVLSKNREKIYHPKERHKPYRSLTFWEALTQSEKYFSSSILFQPVAKNLDFLVNYRNNAMHFYNQNGFGVVIYGLAQTSIVNYRDLMQHIYGVDIAEEITINLLPLAFGRRPDPVEFLQNARSSLPKNKAIAQYLKEIDLVTKELEAMSIDTGRFLTTFTVTLQSVKKVSSAEIVVGISSAPDASILTIVEKRVDPNVSHPLRRKDILKEIDGNLHGSKFSAHTFEALAYKYELKTKPHFGWRPIGGGSCQYSRDVMSLLRGLTSLEIEAALHDYKKRPK